MLKVIRVKANFPFCSIENSNSLMDASVRASSCVRTSCTHTHTCEWLYLGRVGKRRRRTAEKGGHMSGNGEHPLRVGVPVGIHTYTYTRHSLFPIHFLSPAPDFLPWRLPAYARMTRRPPSGPSIPTPLFGSPFGVRHPASCGARRFLFQIFSISMKGETHVD